MMYGMVIAFRDESFAAVAPTKKLLREWQADMMRMEKISGPVVAWRMRDTTGWCDGTNEAWKHIPNFGASGGNDVNVLWG